MNKPYFAIIASFLAFQSCQPSESGQGTPITSKDTITKTQRTFPKVFSAKNGKVLNVPIQQELFREAALDSLDIPVIDAKLVQALDKQLRLLKLRKQKKVQQIGNLRINLDQLRKTIEILKSYQQTKPLDLYKQLDAHQIWGRDRKGNVKFTGYFTPLIKVSRQPTPVFKYPIYNRPWDWEGPLPTRQKIEGEGVLKGLGLELAYASNKVDIYYMQVQGSGYVEYPDGEVELFSYNGTNRHPYRSIEKFIINREDIKLSNLSIAGIKSHLKRNPDIVDTVLFANPSYTFFAPKSTSPIGAGHVELTEGISIAVDRRYIPLGSSLLAAFPVYDTKSRKVIRHDFRILLAQDVGGVVKGPGHVDYYFGVGNQAQRDAGRLNHYGRLWVLLPKRPQAQLTSN